MDRQPVVAGQFYPGDAGTLQNQVEEYLTGEKPEERTLLAMLPHAGYVFSGKVAGQTIARCNLFRKIILLGPNHSGRGERIAVWKDGKWPVPGLEARVDSKLAQAVLQVPGFAADYKAHLHEHSLEVIVPFLGAVLDDFSIVPVAVSETDPSSLIKAGKSLAGILKDAKIHASLVVSSDMSHYISDDQARKADGMAIDRALALDPEGLYRVVADNNISMCGVLPMVLGLACARELGARNAVLTGYSTSGEVNSDYSRVVGYAGIVVS